MALGGVTDCAVSLADAVKDKAMGGPDRPALFEGIAMMANTLWRSMEFGGAMICAADCDASVDTFADCSCSCPTVDSWKDTEADTAAYDLLDSLGLVQMLASESATKNYFTASPDGTTRVIKASDGENKSFWKWLVDFSCHPGKMGPFATPLAANNDPLFWVSHASWGRYWHFVQLSPKLSASFHNDWADPTVSTFMDGYTNVTDCEKMLKEDDRLPFKGFTAGGHGRHYSNGELLELLKPTNPELPYVYADFEWAHCDDDDDAAAN
jgi:hypothetical protein